MTDIIRLNNLQILATHGCYENEKMHPQAFIVTVACSIEGKLNASDQLHHTVNYENVRAIALQVFEQPPVNLIETLANQIADRVLKLEKVVLVEVSIKKPEIWKDCVPELMITRSR